MQAEEKLFHAYLISAGTADERDRLSGELARTMVCESKGQRPCGVCRQVMTEFCGPEFEIIIVDEGGLMAHTLGELLPLAFSPSDLEKR